MHSEILPGVIGKATGEVVTYEFSDRSTGELTAMLHLRVTGGIVSIRVTPEQGSKLNRGDWWEFVGPIEITGGKDGRAARLSMPTIHAARFLRKAAAPTEVVWDFGDTPANAAPALPSTNGTKAAAPASAKGVA